MEKYIRFRHILVVVWGLILCFNLMVCLNGVVTSFSWFVIGILVGGIFIILTDNPLFKADEDFKCFLMKHIKKLHTILDETLMPLKKSKNVSGVKK